jgi:hypothetical protein
VHEDAGYLIEGGGAGQWLTRMPDAGQLLKLQTDIWLIEASFNRVLHEELTPPKLILLRLLNLTVLRWQWLGDIFRKLIVGRLAEKGSSLQVRMLREIRFDVNSIHVTDIFRSEKGLPSALAGASLLRCRRVTGNHMASACYFQPVEKIAFGMWVELQDQSLSCDPTLRFTISGAKI